MSMLYFIDAKSPSGSTAVFRFVNNGPDMVELVEELLVTDHSVSIYRCERVHFEVETRKVLVLSPQEQSKIHGEEKP